MPCDLAAVGEAPGATEVEQGRGFVGPSGGVLWARPDYPNDAGLMEVVLERPRATCYVSNVCKEPIDDAAWRQLNLYQRDVYVNALLAELDAVQPKLVLAFGMRAAKACVPDFDTISKDHGKPVLGPTGKWMAMALWHPAAYLRGNSQAFGDIAADLAKVPALLAEGLVELLQPAPVCAPPPLEWPKAIAFLSDKGARKTGRCLLCGKGEVRAYEGNGVKWKLCVLHASLTATWAETHLEEMRDHAKVAEETAAAKKYARTAEKMQAQLVAGADVNQ